MAAGVCSSLLCTKSSITSCFFQTSSSSNSNSTQISFRPTTRFTNIVSCVKSGRSSSGHEAVGEGHWVVVVKPPSPHQGGSRSHVVDYYVEILERVLGSEKDAQGCIYNACCDTKFWFCCDVDQQTAQQLAGLAEVLSVDEDLSSFPGWKHWAVDVLQVPEIRSSSRPQLVDYYTQMLTKVLENEKDAQMCIYDVSLQPPNYGFCCQLDEESARELAGVPGVLSVKPDYNGAQDGISGGSQPTNIIKTKKLFVTGLSFYTSEKTLREAFEGFGELVEVKIIMDKISKRSKGYAFIEYTTEEAAAAALTEMNGKIINGWMIVVDVAKTSPPKYTRRPSR